MRDGDPEGEGVIWPHVAEVSLLGGLGAGKLLLELVVEELEAHGSPYDFLVLQVDVGVDVGAWCIVFVWVMTMAVVLLLLVVFLCPPTVLTNNTACRCNNTATTTITTTAAPMTSTFMMIADDVVHRRLRTRFRFTSPKASFELGQWPSTAT